jgi:dTDP-4-amino-4,6-dideoxygalactose transaminase
MVSINPGLRMSLIERDATASKPARKTSQKPESKPLTTIAKPMTLITKNIKAADPIPEAGIAEAVELMRAGALYRYNVPDAASSVVSQVEAQVSAYTGHTYCVALNSCGSALFLALKCAGVQAGDKVLTNAFTFAAVPSAIEHAGGVATYVETDWDFCIDTADLEAKMNQHPDAKFLMVRRRSHRFC